MERTTRGPAANRLLDRLSRASRAKVLVRCEHVELVLDDVLAVPGTKIRDVYFPTRSSISLLTPMDGDAPLEVALAGNEGLYGIPIALGIAVSPVHARIQGAGGAWRMASAAFQQELARLPSFRDSVDRYIFVAMSQLMRTAGCNRFHVVEQRVARWMLMVADRAHSPTFHITHEFLARMLGVRRVGVTEAASALQQRGLIGYRRGAVMVLDRKGLERASCRCYREDLEDYERFLGARHAKGGAPPAPARKAQ